MILLAAGGLGLSSFRDSGALQAAPTKAQIQAAIDRAVQYIKDHGREQSKGYLSLAALAVLKAEGSADAPLVAQAIAAIRGRVQNGEYVPVDRGHTRIYTAGVDLMILANSNPSAYYADMQAIARYLLYEQKSGGFWDYPPDVKQNITGDTSMTLYALLGLWAAQRSGIDVPSDVWDRTAQWHLRKQRSDGGFTYRPGAVSSPHPGSTHTMTTTGAGSLLIARMHLFPDDAQIRRQQEQQEADKPKPKFGVLRQRDVEAARPDDGGDEGAAPTVSKAAIDGAVQRALDWCNKFWGFDRIGHYNMYYFYALERMCALGEFERIGSHDWYAEGAEYLLGIQKDNGRFEAGGGVFQSNSVAQTAFGVLFLTKATAKALGRGGPSFGAGLLAGGRGIPDNLENFSLEDGEVKERKPLGPVDELLKELEKPRDLSLQQAQSAFVEKVQLGNRKALIGQKERLKKLVRHPNPEVRRTAVWALGRTDDLKLVPLLIRALQDPDVGVMTEAHNALCWLSRNPGGWGLPAGPLAELPENPAESRKKAAIERWRAEAVKTWRKWFQRVRPYEQRDQPIDVSASD